MNPDDWWTLTVNAWLTSFLSVGLVSAFGCVIFLRTATMLVDGRRLPALLATGGFAWGTLFFPYATMLYEHDVMAVAFLAAFWLLLASGIEGDRAANRSRRPAYAGICAGSGVAANYIGLPVAVLLGVYALRRLGARRTCAYVSGLLPPLAAIALYDIACFGAPWATSYASQNPIFREPASFSAFSAPRVSACWCRYCSRLFEDYSTARRCCLRRRQAGVAFTATDAGESRQCSSPASSWCFSSSTSASTTGRAAGRPGRAIWSPRFPSSHSRLPPRSIVSLWRRAFWPSRRFARCCSSPPSTLQAPILLREPLWRYDPLFDYELPLFLESPTRIVLAETQSDLIVYERVLENQRLEAEDRERLLERARLDLAEAYKRGETRLFPASTRRGPVSANPAGIYEPEPYRLFPPGSEPAIWNSFNVGEFVLPRSRASLLPLLAIAGCLFGGVVRACASQAEPNFAGR